MRPALIALAAAALAAAIPATGALATSEPEIEMEDFAFRPARKVVGRGQLVTWKNRDHAPHDAASLARRSGRRLFRTRTVGFRGEATARAPRTRGTYRYLCTVHPYMRGVLIVR